MSTHRATILWERGEARFTDSRYSREHRWRFDGGVEIGASASPHIVPVPLSNESAVDPEEAYVAALASCHMLWFLSLAARHGLVVESYSDEAVGELARDRSGALAMTRITMRPRVAFLTGRRPSPEEHEALHRDAHDLCFLSRSVRTEIVIEPADVSH